jgi:predicted nucleic acid-binding protein
MRRFFDTNVLVYMQDPRDAAKREKARDAFKESIADGSFVVSAQVLAEFYVVTVRRRLLGPSRALELVRFYGAHDTVPHTQELVTRGLELHQAHALSPWDGLIVQAALDARCDVLLSEDLQDGRRFGDLVVANPFLTRSAHEAPARSNGVRKRATSRKARHARA